ncbi:zonular occludens toxin domain-containing protein [Methylomonas methanica]|uniref:Zonular occludens toxin n=1 Tax=Methylomonas methanica (strain DSM 25384 / MC09) TaxID=857087 RepID=G0A211_METMM|nr:zonular occludens toxin domain-containing protein [Methylomonas methanica]AEG02554.1 Zonular occludens toxin [Methylomonas methanica MC09]
MPGWIIQGVRGEGKSLCAVAKVREYLNRGCPVATNLDLFLENLLLDENQAIAYRLPDRPRYEDFLALPPAYDPKYKLEDHNGLIVLDELALWMNARSWKEKGRKELIEWLLLSRKDHWDLILLTQDHELIDKQIKNTLCDYLVQASRTDRRKIPYIGPILEFMFLSGNMPKYHLYDVYYGMSFLDARVEQWRYRGTDLYDGYDTNQRFNDGNEILGKRVVDMRAIYTYLPACYLTKQIYINRLQTKIDDILEAKPLISNEVETMAKKKINPADAQKPKIILMSLFLVGFLVWRFGFGEVKLPGSGDSLKQVLPVQAAPVPAESSNTTAVASSDKDKPKLSPVGGGPAFVDALVTSYRPRLAALVSGKDRNGDTVITGLVEFYDGDQLVERFMIDQLKSFGCSVVLRPYGVDIMTAGGVYAVSAWPRPKTDTTEPFRLTASKSVQPVSNIVFTNSSQDIVN